MSDAIEQALANLIAAVGAALLVYANYRWGGRRWRKDNDDDDDEQPEEE